MFIILRNNCRLVRAASAQDTKDRLKAVSDEALERGAFGAPTFYVNKDTMVFGSDRFELIAHLLDEPYPGMYRSNIQ
eukprot:m.198832 g.198832  ORF g.198832 m.198832 type:complete len:77 (-) comp14927_c0_seq4:212-442(-)